ncbi:MAG: MobF family relaxase, partial [Acidimicrobiia bacterium]
MLSLAKAVKDYYLQKLGELSPREDYYLRGGTATGRWVGSGAFELDLHGTVSAEGLVRLFDGEHPGTRQRLGRRLRKDGVAAWDVTFSADKSVSLLWALGDERTRKEVVEAFEEASFQALGYLESVASATRGASKRVVVDEQGRRKKRVVTWPITTSGYVAAAFTEYTSRADDPQLHTHVVIANKVKGVDGVWRTLDGRLLYRHQLAAGYLHEAVLRKELTERLGVRWQPVQKGMANIEGFTRTQIEAFSRRREQSEAWREEQGLAATPAARQVAVVATRQAKQDHPLDELEVEWRQRAAELGLTPERITRILDRSRQVTAPDPTRLFQRLASAEGVTAKTATFGRSEVVREIAASLREGGDRAKIETLADQFLEQERVVTLSRNQAVGEAEQWVGTTTVSREPSVAPMQRRDGISFPGVTDDHRYTTADLLATEQRILDRALNREPVTWRAPRRLVEAALRRRPHLTGEQREMVRRLAGSGAGIDVGVGPAGSGKTTVMAVLAELAAITATPILGAALAARTAVGLQEATGIPSSSLTALHDRATREDGLPREVIVVVDEASMVGTRQLATLSDQVAAAGGKLILIGDHHQLPEIEAGGLFQTLVRRLPAVELHLNVRQEQAWERTALTELRDGSVADAVASYRRHHRLVFSQSRDDTLVRAARDWYQHLTDAGDITSALLMAPDNETVTRLNHLARNHLAGAGHLHGPTIQAGGREYQAGDRVICLRNNPRLGVLNGDIATVIVADPEKRTLTVHLDREPETRDLPGWYLDGGQVDYGYALTGHKAQGVTVDRTFAVIGYSACREWAYVAMSRGREANTAYLACPDTPEPCAHLCHQSRHDPLEVAVASLQRRDSQSAAVE